MLYTSVCTHVYICSVSTQALGMYGVKAATQVEAPPPPRQLIDYYCYYCYYYYLYYCYCYYYYYYYYYHYYE